MIIVGFDPDDAAIRFAKSRGFGWGVDGFGRMSAEDARWSVAAMWAIDVPAGQP